MRVPDNNWLARLQRATQAEGPSSTTATADKNLVEAGDDIFTKAQQMIGALGGSPAEAAERLWSARGQDGVPGLAERVVTDGADKATVHEICTADMKDVAELVDQLAVRMLAGEGREEELHRLLELKSVIDSGDRLIPAYNRAQRSLLAHQRTAEQVDPKIGPALKAIGERLNLHYLGARATEATETVRERAVETSGKIWKVGGRILKDLKARSTGENAVAGWVKSVVSDLKGVASSFIPDRYLAKLEQAKAGAVTLVDSMNGIENVESDREIAARFNAALPAVVETMDAKADAVAIGTIQETAALVTGGSGHEVVYVRETGELHMNELKAVGGRLGVGGTMRAFTRNVYGDVANEDGNRRRGYEVGVVCGHIGISGGKGDDAPRGWHTTFSLGFNASLPLLADQSVFDIREKRIKTVKLAPQEIAKIEDTLAGVSKTAQSWHTTMRRKTQGA